MRTGRALRSAKDFRRLVATGTRAKRDGITVFATPRHPAHESTRAGLSVRLPGAGAVARNRVRRRLRHAFAEVAPETGWDVVIRANGATAGRTFQELRDDLARALAKATEPA